MFKPFFLHLNAIFSTNVLMYSFSNPVMSSLVLCLCHFDTLTENIIHCFIFHTFYIYFLLVFIYSSILALITLVRIACSCVAMINDSVSLLIPVLLCQSHLSFPASSSVCLRNCPCNIIFFPALLPFIFRVLNSFSLSPPYSFACTQ